MTQSWKKSPWDCEDILKAQVDNWNTRIIFEYYKENNGCQQFVKIWLKNIVIQEGDRVGLGSCLPGPPTEPDAEGSPHILLTYIA